MKKLKLKELSIENPTTDQIVDFFTKLNVDATHYLSIYGFIGPPVSTFCYLGPFKAIEWKAIKGMGIHCSFEKEGDFQTEHDSWNGNFEYPIKLTNHILLDVSDKIIRIEIKKYENLNYLSKQSTGKVLHYPIVWKARITAQIEDDDYDYSLIINLTDG